MNSSDNQKGLALAISSSLFIGSSFIVKKKGLLRARKSGNGAGAGGYAYLYEPLWWAGLLTMVFGEIANFTAYVYAPAILVTPLGALSVIISAILASMILQEKLTILGKVGCAMCIIGSTVIILNAPAETAVNSVKEITDQIMLNLGFQLYCVMVIAATTTLIVSFSPRYGRSNIMVYVSICSMVGSLSVIAVKGLGIALRLTFGGSNQMMEASTWIFIIMVAVCIMIQMNYLNKALDVFSTALVTPIYYVMFTTFTIIASAILFRGWEGDDTVHNTMNPETVSYTKWSMLITCLCGFLTICSGVFLLHFSKDNNPNGIPSTEFEMVQLTSQISNDVD